MNNIIVLCVLLLSAGVNLDHPVPFALGETELTGGPLLERRQIDEKYLLEDVDADRLLAVFREVAGLPKKAERYGGKWEGKGINGHSLGHYLSALSALYACEKNCNPALAAKAKEKIDYIVSELKACQDANGDGYCLTVDKDVYDAVKHDGEDGKKFRVGGFSLNDWWVPNYTLHKVFAGLYDAYHLAGNQDALAVETKLGKWYADTVRNLPPDRAKALLRCEWGGLNESFVQLYKDTGDKDFLWVAEDRFNDPVFERADSSPSDLSGLHANTQIPKFVGLCALYEATSNAQYRTRAENFWHEVVERRSFSTGGHSQNEHFYDMAKGAEKLDRRSGETCNVNNLIRMSGHLFTWEPTADKMDFVERGLYNQIAAQIGKEPGEFGYFLSMAPTGYKLFSTKDKAWWCCVGTGMENPFHYTEHTYYHTDDTLYVNLFMPSKVTWKGVTLEQITDYPYSGKITLKITGGSLNLKVRRPYWAGGPEYVDYPNAAGTIVIDYPMSDYEESLTGAPDYKARMHGPLVMAAVIPPARGPDPAMKRYDDHLAGMRVHAPKNATWTMKPLMDIYREHYSIYFHNGNPMAIEEPRIEDHRLDYVEPGFQQSEVDHDFKDYQTDSGDEGELKYRMPQTRDGWFSYTLKVNPKARNKLVITWSIQSHDKRMVIFIDDKKFTEVHLERQQAQVPVYDIEYDIPRKFTDGKESVTFKFAARHGADPAPIYKVTTAR